LIELGPAIVTLAEAEGLTQHARSITVRLPASKTASKKVTKKW
jgi:histidinol dehydrogenase